MKKHIKHLLLSSIATVAFFGNIQSSVADVATDTEKLLNWAQNSYKNFFPSIQPTQTLAPWLYRFYPETGIYAGVNIETNDVYVMGGQFGNNPQRVDSLASMITTVDNSGTYTGIPGCDTTKMPAGFTATQSGNVVTVTTNGQCIAMPTDDSGNVCDAPPQPTATGISTLGENTINQSEVKGVQVPSGPNANVLQQFVDATAKIKTCTINADQESANLIINADICLDITSAIQDLASSIPGITITPPVTYHMKSTATNQVVSDCFATDASFIDNAFTGESWVKENGTFVKVGG
ncbi:MAG: hypothetical protein LM517_11060 [Nitrosomonas sp.]|nr:hypothetical protein [Nitrosomonas sp.]